MDSEETTVEDARRTGEREAGPAGDRAGRRAYAGRHLIVDLDGATNLDDRAAIERALRAAVRSAGATLLHLHIHSFGSGGGISGVAVLAESHISIHTWPEQGYAALDIFMCGDCDPRDALPPLREAFAPEAVAVHEHIRGRRR